MPTGWTAASDLSTARCDENHNERLKAGPFMVVGQFPKGRPHAFVRNDLLAAMPIGCVKTLLSPITKGCIMCHAP